ADGECIGTPIYFFFALNTTHLTDTSQRLNLDELARVAKKYSLSVRVTGAADSSTGTSSINDSLSISRAGFITAELEQRGIPAKRIIRVSKGGIADYTPVEANRHTKVELFFPKAK
ncbi:OmpA family protein, partial [Phocaeicola vulgatus]|nr:OmpA family protein [Phocaeicola vulgatus]